MMGLSGGERAWGASRRSSQRHFWLFAHGAEACAGPTCCRTMTMPLRTVFTGCTEKIVTAGTGRRESTCGNGTHQATVEAMVSGSRRGEERPQLAGGRAYRIFLVDEFAVCAAHWRDRGRWAGNSVCSTVAEMKPPLCL